MCIRDRLYIAIVMAGMAVSLLAGIPHFREVGHLEKGCYWTSAVAPYVECRNLFANSIVSWFLNHWMAMIYTVMFSVYLVTIPNALLYWCPALYLVWYAFKGKHLTRQLTTLRPYVPPPDN